MIAVVGNKSITECKAAPMPYRSYPQGIYLQNRCCTPDKQHIINRLCLTNVQKLYGTSPRLVGKRIVPKLLTAGNYREIKNANCESLLWPTK